MVLSGYICPRTNRAFAIACSNIPLDIGLEGGVRGVLVGTFAVLLGGDVDCSRLGDWVGNGISRAHADMAVGISDKSKLTGWCWVT